MIAGTTPSLEGGHAIHHLEQVMGTVVTIDVYLLRRPAHKRETYQRIAPRPSDPAARRCALQHLEAGQPDQSHSPR